MKTILYHINLKADIMLHIHVRTQYSIDPGQPSPYRILLENRFKIYSKKVNIFEIGSLGVYNRRRVAQGLHCIASLYVHIGICSPKRRREEREVYSKHARNTGTSFKWDTRA